MKKFSPLLRKINEQLNLPQPIKSRIILEMAADLDDLYETYLAKGFNEEEAVRKVEEKFDMSNEALSELICVHESVFSKMLARFSQQAQTRWERIVLAIITLFLAAMGFKIITTTHFLMQASNLIWPILAIFLIVLSISIKKFYTLFIKKDHNTKKLRIGLPSILFLGCGNLLIGICGYFFELYSAGSRMMYSGLPSVIITVIKGNEILFFSDVERIIKSASMAMVCVFVTIFIALIWFSLVNKITKIEQSEAAYLLED